MGIGAELGRTTNRVMWDYVLLLFVMIIDIITCKVHTAEL